VAGFCEHSNEPSGSIKKEGYFLTSWVTVNFSNNILHHGVCEWVSEVSTNYWCRIVRKIMRNWLKIAGTPSWSWDPLSKNNTILYCRATMTQVRTLWLLAGTCNYDLYFTGTRFESQLSCMMRFCELSQLLEVSLCLNLSNSPLQLIFDKWQTHGAP
jgi:hypothetical protein